MNPLNKELRKRMLDGDRLQAMLKELRGEGLRNVLDQGEAACMRHEGQNHVARSAMHSLATIGMAMSELSLSMQNAFPSLDWVGFKALRNYIAHDYLSREMPVVWDAVVADSMAAHDIPDYIKEAIGGQDPIGPRASG